MLKTYIRPARDLRNHFAELSRIVKQEKNPVIITNRGRGDMVLIDFEDYEEYEKFVHEKYVLRKLSESLEQAADPNTKWLSHQEVWDDINKNRLFQFRGGIS